MRHMALDTAGKQTSNTVTIFYYINIKKVSFIRPTSAAVDYLRMDSKMYTDYCLMVQSPF